MSGLRQSSVGSAGAAKQGAEARDLSWAEASVWTECIVSALVTASKEDSSHKPGYSLFTRPGARRDTPDEETTNWRAVCGKTARAVRRAGRRKPSRPLSFSSRIPRFLDPQIKPEEGRLGWRALNTRDPRYQV